MGWGRRWHHVLLKLNSELYLIIKWLNACLFFCPTQIFKLISIQNYQMEENTDEGLWVRSQEPSWDSANSHTPPPPAFPSLTMTKIISLLFIYGMFLQFQDLCRLIIMKVRRLQWGSILSDCSDVIKKIGYFYPLPTAAFQPIWLLIFIDPATLGLNFPRNRKGSWKSSLVWPAKLPNEMKLSIPHFEFTMADIVPSGGGGGSVMWLGISCD